MYQATETERRPASLLGGLVRPAIVSAVLFMGVAGLAYPLVTTGVAQLVFPHAANGSLIDRNGMVVGSAVIGQQFTQAQYFHPRPSATTGADPKDPSKTVSQPYNAASSGASNYGPTSKALMDQVKARADAYRAENGMAADALVPVDAVTASGSGLDPDISLANARLQANRVAKARGMTADQVQALIDRLADGRQGGVLGEPRLDVLKINLALDQAASQPKPNP